MSKTTLIVMRHAKSDWESGVSSDFDRPLARRGMKDAPRMGRWLLENFGVPERIVCSPARRAAETTRLVLLKSGCAEMEVFADDRIYDGSLSDLLQVIGDHRSCRSLLLVGHNPGLDDLVEHLSAGSPPRSESGKLMTTSAIAILQFKDRNIGTTAGCAKIKVIQRPRDL